ncbi:hypothetical protein PUN4_20020 [Paraburkholderia unamae]|nr:hypothetical protein PUN4_20020 [Paraburkholderia unamae]
MIGRRKGHIERGAGPKHGRAEFSGRQGPLRWLGSQRFGRCLSSVLSLVRRASLGA